ncbi:MAG TPA: GspH/FimT family pseudopilin [Longimicrobiaceae bacterium]|nr:GspH/FimT family pseudopilin [Longimicrobiaceae bacterium]
MHKPALRPRRLAAGGFSLVELVVVVSLMGIVAMLAAPRFANLVSVLRTRGAMDQVAGDLAFTRMAAVRAGRTASLRFDGATYMVTLDNGAVAYDTLRTMSFTREYPGVYLSSTSSRIAFDSRGVLRDNAAQSVTIVRNGRIKTLRISSVGRIYRDN